MVCKRRVVFPYDTTFNKIPIFRPHCTKCLRDSYPKLRVECSTKRI